MINGLTIGYNGTKWWYCADKLHREDGPAIEYDNGDKYWMLNNEYHREDGPAVEFASGHKRWYWHGKELGCQTQEEFLRLMKLKAFW